MPTLQVLQREPDKRGEMLMEAGNNIANAILNREKLSIEEMRLRAEAKKAESELVKHKKTSLADGMKVAAETNKKYAGKIPQELQGQYTNYLKTIVGDENFMEFGDLLGKTLSGPMSPEDQAELEEKQQKAQYWKDSSLITQQDPVYIQAMQRAQAMSPQQAQPSQDINPTPQEQFAQMSMPGRGQVMQQGAMSSPMLASQVPSRPVSGAEVDALSPYMKISRGPSGPTLTTEDPRREVALSNAKALGAIQVKAEAESAKARKDLDSMWQMYTQAVDSMGGVGKDPMTAQLKDWSTSVTAKFKDMPDYTAFKDNFDRLVLSLAALTNQGRPTDKDAEMVMKSIVNTNQTFRTSMAKMAILRSYAQDTSNYGTNESDGARFGKLSSNAWSEIRRKVEKVSDSDVAGYQKALQAGISQDTALKVLLESVNSRGRK